MTPPLIERQRIATVAMKRFRDVPFQYGTADCARLGAFVLRERGHNAGLAKIGKYRTALGAARAMKRLGFDTIEQAVNAVGLERIPPAAALAADLVLIPGPEPFHGAITMAVGNGRVLGWHEDAPGALVMHPVEYRAAWRV